MKTSTTSQRLKQLLSERALKQVDVLERAKAYAQQCGVKLTKADLSQYVSGKVEPGQDKLALLGLALDVSEAWLMGYDVPMERQRPAGQADAPSITFDEFTYALHSETQTLTDENKAKLLEMARFFKMQQELQKNGQT